MQNYPLNYKNRGSNAFDVFVCVIICALMVLAVFRIAFGLTYVKVYVVGSSMDGTLIGADSKGAEGGDYVYIFRTSSPRRGDIAVIKTDDYPIIKRVIALGGDTVALRGGVLYVNGKVVDEPYVKESNNSPSNPKNTYPETTVPEGYMFFMGDNRDVSVDSRSDKYKMMPVENTMGVVADWSMSFKWLFTAVNTFFDFKIGRGAHGFFGS
ncbi:MAG: signal peptidase I [Roseburia sp.]|nr:signal peptidase I [Roseburia sp.]